MRASMHIDDRHLTVRHDSTDSLSGVVAFVEIHHGGTVVISSPSPDKLERIAAEFTKAAEVLRARQALAVTR